MNYTCCHFYIWRVERHAGGWHGPQMLHCMVTFRAEDYPSEFYRMQGAVLRYNYIGTGTDNL